MMNEASEHKSNLALIVALLAAGFFFLFGFLFVLLIAVVGVDSSMEAKGDVPIGIVEITGAIEDSTQVLKDIRAFRNDEDIKAIVIRVDSPGGAVGPSQEIYAEIQKTRQVKKVVSTMNSMGASGGYYIACAADKVFANAGTLTGSIGVILQNFYLRDALDALKLQPRTYKSGKHKDILSPFREMEESDDELINEVIADVYDQFLSDVATARKLDKEVIRPLADGRVMTGRQALEAKLVDQLGNFYDAVDEAVALAGEEGTAKLVYPEKDNITYFEELLKSSVQIVTKTVMESSQTKVEFR